MMHPYLTLNDDTEITHSELRPPHYGICPRGILC